MTGPTGGQTDGPFRPGEPAWIELSSAEPAAAEVFYRGLLGWSVRHERLASGTYRMCSVDGHDVAGIADAALLHGSRPQGWITYFAVADVATTANRAVDLGGELLLAPRYLPDAGTGAAVIDPFGAVFGLYRGEARVGVESLNSIGALCWNELSTGEPDGSVAYYRRLFGYETDHRDSPTDHAYTVLTLEDEPVAGVLELDNVWPNVLPAQWIPYLRVASLSDAVDRVLSLGGSASMGPVASPHGALHVVRDPEGHAFTLIELESGLRQSRGHAGPHPTTGA
ncbi:VOC family protein [Nocardioides sp.]|uniref:VOC family protein n=1 Tax=Nocardioides sp. TaxID=35761 RepID=UPI002735AFA9|nr:VOC family protein [Nocardioides sp.]MDP3891464.1 VOC family protein [Nocardioides sp.]